jgi:general secretion pathway protein J
LRMTRRGTASPADGVVVAAWTRRVIDGNGTWLRWQSAPATTREQLQQAWQKADLWSQNPGDEERRGEVAITALEEWQIVYFRGGAWTNPQSSDAAGIFGAVGAPNTILPDGVRLILTLPPGQPITGRLTRDWARPTLSGGKS